MNFFTELEVLSVCALNLSLGDIVFLFPIIVPKGLLLLVFSAPSLIFDFIHLPGCHIQVLVEGAFSCQETEPP